jgi:predicted O-methyltransferase YrrM
MFIKKKTIKDLLPTPMKVAHSEYTLILSNHDDMAKPSDYLIDISLQAVSFARKVDLSDISNRIKYGTKYPDMWPGEHYKLLAGFVKALNPKLVIEIGTATGTSTLSLKKHLDKDAKVVTYDLFSWKDDEKTVLCESDFEDGQLSQKVDDISYTTGFEKNKPLLEKAELIFIDASHDGKCETRILNNLKKIKFQKPPILIFDDIRIWTLLKFWREIDMPKLDLTSFGHWSGTGIVEWKQ